MKNRIKQLRKELNLTQEKFAERMNIKRNTLANYEIGRNEPIPAVIELICREFNVNEEWLRNGTGEMFDDTIKSIIDELVQTYHLDAFDRRMIEEYAKLTDAQRKAIKEYMHNIDFSEWETEDTSIAFVRVVDGGAPPAEAEEAEEEPRQLPLFDYPASAGLGAFVDRDYYDLVDVPIDVPNSASYGVKIKGHSMEPEIPNGSIVWVKQQPDVDNGEICIISVNDKGYCKKKIGNEFVSINPNHHDVTINIEDEYNIGGKVVYVQEGV